MRITAVLLFALLIVGCEKTFDNIIDTSPNNFQVESVRPIDSIAYNPADSLITIRINFSGSSSVDEVFCDVIASDDTKLNASPLRLFDNGDSSVGDDTKGDNKFANKFPLSQFYPNGIYTIDYFVKNNDQSLQKVAVGTFKYSNGQDNLPPFIENDIIEPDTVVVTDTTIILTSVEASDSNGQNDIEMVFFIVYKPDGSTNNVKLELFDDGNVMDHGDLTAGDGIYSLLIQVDQSNDKGTYRFEFQAKDRGGKYSNIINHFVLIQ